MPRTKKRASYMGCHAVETSSGKIALRFRWTQPDGVKRYHSVTTPYPDKGSAMLKAAVIGAELKAGEFDPWRHFEPPAQRFGLEPRRALSGDSLIVAKVNAWIDAKELRKVRKSRIRDYRSHVENYVEKYDGDPFADLSRFQTWLVQRVSEKTARNVIRGTLRAYARDNRIELAAFDALTWERYAPTRRQDPFESHEATKLLAYFRSKRPFDEYVSLRLRFSGLRPSEVRGLQVGDFGRKKGELQISRSVHLGSEGATKTVAAERTITLSVLEAIDVAKICGIRDPKERILTVAEDTLRDNFTKAQIALGIRHRSLYQAKHTYATLALDAGALPALVANHLGISLATLEKHYMKKRSEKGQLHQGLHQANEKAR